VLVGATGQCRSPLRSIPTSIITDPKSFIPLNMIASFPLVLCAGRAPGEVVKEMVAWAQGHPDKSNYGTSSPAFTIASDCSS